MAAPKHTAVVVGCGFIGPVHVEGLRRAGVHVAGIVGSTAEEAADAAGRLGLPRGYDSFDEAIADPDVDVVHIATPNRLHFEMSRAALAAGKHVLCEKPLAMRSSETAELVRLAEQSGLLAAVAYNLRHYPLCHEAAERFRSGACGELLHVSGSYCQDWLLKPTDFNWRVVAEEGGELRAVADVGTHWLDLVQFVTGQRVVAVCADLRTVHLVRHAPTGGAQTFSGGGGPRETQPVDVNTEDCGAVMLRFENGANGSLWVSQTTAGVKNRAWYEIAGAEQSIGWRSDQPNELRVGHRDRANEQLTRDPALMGEWGQGQSNYPGGHNEGFPDTFKQLFRSFYGCLADRDHPARFATFADGHHEVLLCEAILASARERRWTDVAAAD